MDGQTQVPREGIRLPVVTLQVMGLGVHRTACSHPSSTEGQARMTRAFDITHTDQSLPRSVWAIVAELVALDQHSEDDVFLVGPGVWHEFRTWLRGSDDGVSPESVMVTGIPVWLARSWDQYRIERVPRGMVHSSGDGNIIGG